MLNPLLGGKFTLWTHLGKPIFLFHPLPPLPTTHTLQQSPTVSLKSNLYIWRYRGGSRIFFRRGCTRLLLYFNTNKPHFFFFLQNIICIRKPQVISGGGGGAHPLHPPPRSAPALPLFRFIFRFAMLLRVAVVTADEAAEETTGCAEKTYL